jgi:hypothetical protein
MAYENLSTFTEVDPNSHLSSNSTRTTSSGLTRSEDAYTYKDYGANYFDALDIDFIAFTNSSSTDGGFQMVCLSNTVNDLSGFASTDVTFITAEIGSGNVNLYLTRGALVSTDVYNTLTTDTIYYCTLKRVSGNNTVTCEIYSNAARTNLLDTLSVSGFGTVKWRYLFTANTFNDGSSDSLHNGYIENIDLNEVAGNLSASVFDSISVSEDVSSKASPFYIDVFDSVTVTETITSLEKNLVANVFDLVTVSENITTNTSIPNLNLDIFNPVNVSENVVVSSVLNIGIAKGGVIIV